MRKEIAIRDLKVGTILQASIQDSNGKVLFSKGFPLTESALERLRRWSTESGRSLYVEEDMTASKLTQEEKSSRVSSCLENIYNASGINLINAIEDLKSFSSHLYDDLKTIEDLPADCVEIKYANNKGGHYYRLTKMVLALANLYNKDVPPHKRISIESIRLASLLHDYGKRFQNDEEGLKRLTLDSETTRKTKIKPSMIEAPYRNEFHSVYAYISLKGKVSEDVRKTILCCNYIDPIIKQNPDTVPYRKAASIIMLCDVYDTLLEHAVVSDMSIPFENVISYMSQLAHNNTLDKELFNLFLKHIPIYPNGIKVLLSNGESAVVVERTPEFPTKPVVLTLTPGKSTLIDLSKTTNITIRRILNDDAKASNKVDAIQEEQLKGSQVTEEVTEEFVPDSLVLQKEDSSKPKSLTKRFLGFLK